ncbi:MAG: long-chain fatty acid--CoA ligase [Bacteroidales bacterium]|nr:long-chain fatty acid--CoA ligase [Bacteroidales bacterium]
MEVKRTFDILEKYTHVFPKKNIALAGIEGSSDMITYSTDDYINNSKYISYGFLHLGVEKGDKIASITFNRPEWNFLDMGISMIGAVHIPIYPTISDKDYEYILKHAEVKYIFVAGEEMYKRIKHIVPNLPALKAVYTFRNLFEIQHLNELIELGKNNPKQEKLEELKNSISENDLATIIYTSGTTGVPKGVILTHKNIVSNFVASSKIPPYGTEEFAMSFLPICHIYERMLNYMYQYIGLTIYYSASLANISEHFMKAEPHIFSTVPRLLEKVFDKIVAKGRTLKGVKKAIFDWSIAVALDYDIGRENEIIYGLKLSLAKKLVLNKIKSIFGKNIDIVVSGGAALQLRLAKFYWALGIHVLEGYGLTETSPVLTVNNLNPGGVLLGSVGLPLDGVVLKIAEDGEILCKTPGVMRGYYKEDAMTKEVFDEEGWFHTGDIGFIEKTGHLRITDRKKLMFKTSFGKYISPQVIENKFKESPYIDQLMVFGENQKFPAALIVPEFVNLKLWCDRKGLKFEEKSEMVNHPDVRNLFKEEVNKYNGDLGDFEKIVKYDILDKEWSIENGELSATLKVRRSYVINKYNDRIKKIFPES